MYPTSADPPPTINKQLLLKLAAFEATFHDKLTPISPDMLPLIIDTGASITVTPCITDFITPIHPVQALEIKGIAAGLQVRGYGDVKYTFLNDAGHEQHLHLKNCLYVPQCTSRLICPRQIGITTGNPLDGFASMAGHAYITVNGHRTTIQYDSISNLPILYTTPGISSYQRFCAQQSYLTKTSAITNSESQHCIQQYMYTNLTKAQQTKLHLHERCAHAHWDLLNSWIRQGLLPCDKAIANAPNPICASCQFGKAHRRTHASDSGHISAQHTAPGDGVSSDGMEAGVPGRVMTTGGSPSIKKLKYCTFWIDHYSQFVYVTMHESKKAEELLRSKHEFEDFSARYGVSIKNIRADNGVYTAKIIHDSCLKKQQNLTFCAVGAHWQNGIAERFIGTVVQRARTVLLHAMSRWPAVIKEDMWPFAVRYAVAFHNASIRRGFTQTPYQLFTGQAAPWTIADFRVFGCPSYVLHKRLQDGDNYNKWKSRCWQGIYMGPSTCHASNIPLIYNHTTTHISPQFHVTYDEGFTSVLTTDPYLSETSLSRLYQKATWHHPPTDTASDYHFKSFWMPPNHATAGSKRAYQDISPQEAVNSSHGRTGVSPANIMPEGVSPSLNVSEGVTPITTIHEGVSPSTNESEGVSPILAEHEGVSPARNESEGVSPIAAEHEGVSSSTTAIAQESTPIPYHQGVSPPPASPTCTSNTRPQYHIYNCESTFTSMKRLKGINNNLYIWQTSSQPFTSQFLRHRPPSDPTLSHTFGDFSDLPVLYTESSIQSFLAVDNKEDTLTQGQMLRAHDRADFIKAQVPELRGLEKMQVFQYCSMTELPPRAKLLSSIWSYRRKRRPTGELLKYKARLCVDGSQQQFGRDFWETYAPVVTWSTVRLILLLSTVLNLKSRQVDYTQAFPQADLPDPVFMRLPQGWFLSPNGELTQHSDPKSHDTSITLNY
jgi:hypothetical protein